MSAFAGLAPIELSKVERCYGEGSMSTLGRDSGRAGLVPAPPGPHIMIALSVAFVLASLWFTVDLDAWRRRRPLRPSARCRCLRAECRCGRPGSEEDPSAGWLWSLVVRSRSQPQSLGSSPGGLTIGRQCYPADHWHPLRASARLGHRSASVARGTQEALLPTQRAIRELTR